MPAQRKPDAERVRRNKPPEKTYLPAEGPSEVPGWPGEWDALFGEYPDARSMWDRLWREPVAHFWRSADRDAIARYCVLTAELTSGNLDDDKVLGRLQMLENKYGMSPKARHDLRWLWSEEGSEPKAAPRKARTLKVVGE